jgi:Uncharacterised nucleotidyltransferase
MFADPSSQGDDVGGKRDERLDIELTGAETLLSQISETGRERHDLDRNTRRPKAVSERAWFSEDYQDVDVRRESREEPEQCDLPAGEPPNMVEEEHPESTCVHVRHVPGVDGNNSAANGHDPVRMLGRQAESSRAAALIAAGTALHADAVAVEAALALAAVDIPSILLRGAVIARHFYGRSEVRAYGDADLLVEHSHRARAEHVFRDLGFEHVAVLGQRAADRPPWSSTWSRRADNAELDLHWSLVGARRPPYQVWETLRREVEPVAVLHSDLQGLNIAAAAFVVALHAAHHGPVMRRTLDDLARALERPREPWEDACRIARELDALQAFGAGLRLLPAGADLAAELRLPATRDVEALLRSEAAPPTALGFDWLARTPGLRRKLVYLGGKLVPDAKFMRAWSPVARSGSRTGLALAYLWRPFWLALHVPSGMRAWLIARRRAGE